jgi:hypothetical protein
MRWLGHVEKLPEYRVIKTVYEQTWRKKECWQTRNAMAWWRGGR